jgi:hypothetical protein
MIAVTIILAALLVALVLPLLNLSYDPTVSDIFQITNIKYTLAGDGIHYIGLVRVSNTDTKNYRNRYLSVYTYVNDRPSDCNIPTLNNDLFISQAVHTGVIRLHGVGTLGNKDYPTSVWPAHSDISIEYKTGRLHPGDRVTLEFFDTTTNQLISRDTWPHGNDNMEKWMRLYFNHRDV